MFTSPPSTWSILMFIKAAAVARARASKRSPWITRMSGRSRCSTSGSFTNANPTLSTIAASSSPLTMVCSLEPISKSSCSINRNVFLQIEKLGEKEDEYHKNKWSAMKSSSRYSPVVSPIVINEMWTKHDNFQFKIIRVRFDPKHDGGQLGVVCSVACCHTHSDLPLILQPKKMKPTNTLRNNFVLVGLYEGNFEDKDGTYRIWLCHYFSLHFFSDSLHSLIVNLLENRKKDIEIWLKWHKAQDDNPLFWT